MIFIDWTILVILIVSSLISIRRGFTKEAMSLASWVAALVIARIFSDNLASLLSNVSIYNIENIDAGANDATHILSNFTLDEFISLTDEDNTLKIFGEDADSIELDPEQNWTQAMEEDGETPYQEDGFNVYYSNQEDQQLKLLIENTITTEVP